ncbi:MAG: threonine synthase [Chitinophagaceae bacterium]|nr:threonine synthase [Chitinophagaceae bacterium]
MKYYSTNKQSPLVSFKEAALRGQAPDRGLYFPERIPIINQQWLNQFRSFPKEELAYQIMQPYVGADISPEKLYQIVTATINFDFPLIQLEEDIYILELFHGPTLAFKDVGARFMSRCLGCFSNQKTTVLVATSGDTGGAVANGFLNVEGVEVIILYPAGKVSHVQELQLTTCGNNITALRIHGTFDDCQQIVKEAFMDQDLSQRLQLTSANSINIARWLPQQLYYFLAMQQWPISATAPIIAVPSGNLGNIAAGLLAKRSGLIMGNFIAACNVNDTITDFLETGIHTPKQAIMTYSNAMDVGNPSNLIRMLEIYQHNMSSLKSEVDSSRQTDMTTINAIRTVYHDHNYILDPHAAVGYSALKQKLKKGEKGLLLATAHPVKFPEIVEKAIGISIPIPESIKPLYALSQQITEMEASYASFKEWICYRNTP